MRIICTTALSFIFLVTGCHSQKSVTLTAENVIFAHLNKDPSIGILVISDARKGPTWYKTQKNAQIETIDNIPKTSMRNVWQITISPDDEYLAILSEGEGHPVVDVFKIKYIFSQRDGWEDRMIAPILILNPYPGTIWIEGWQSDTLLLISSDASLTLMDRETRGGPWQDPSSQTKEFLWDISTDMITEK